MITKLENDFLILHISDQGAEMQSVYSKKLNREILWQADKSIWARHAPVLFPFVGKSKNDSYHFNGTDYPMVQHGFARDKKFTISEQLNDRVVFELQEDEDTLAIYPFRFILQIRYSLKENQITCNYRVINTDTNQLLFSIGAHPGFVCPLFESENFSDYRLLLEKKETPLRYLLSGGLQNGETENAGFIQGDLELKKELFEKDAIVLKNIGSNSILLSSDNYSLSFSWNNMPFFGIWTKLPGAGFICLEPWAGIADSVNSSGNLEEKEGTIKLKTNEQYECGFSFSPQSGSSV